MSAFSNRRPTKPEPKGDDEFSEDENDDGKIDRKETAKPRTGDMECDPSGQAKTAPLPGGKPEPESGAEPDEDDPGEEEGEDNRAEPEEGEAGEGAEGEEGQNQKPPRNMRRMNKAMGNEATAVQAPTPEPAPVMVVEESELFKAIDDSVTAAVQDALDQVPQVICTEVAKAIDTAFEPIAKALGEYQAKVEELSKALVSIEKTEEVVKALQGDLQEAARQTPAPAASRQVITPPAEVIEKGVTAIGVPDVTAAPSIGAVNPMEVMEKALTLVSDGKKVDFTLSDVNALNSGRMTPERFETIRKSVEAAS